MSHLLPSMLLALLLLAAIALVSCQTFFRFSQDTQWIRHTHQVLEDIAAARSDVEQAETGQRGYLLTGSPRYLAPYLAARRQLPTDLSALRRLTGEDAFQQRRLDALTPLVSSKLAELDETVALRRRGQGNAALKIVQTDRGAALMEQIQSVTAQMEGEEQRLLRRREQASETAGRLGQRLIVAGVVLILMLLALALVMGGQYQRERGDRERALRRSQEELEGRVRKRTAEIEAAGAALRGSAQRFRFLADSMPQIVWTTSPQGATDYLNQRWHDYTGLTREETQDGGMEAVIHPDDRGSVAEGWLQAMASGQPYTFEYRLRQAAGEWRWHLGRVLPLTGDAGEIVMWAGTGTDINDYKQAHEEAENRVAERTAELAAANRTLQEDQARLSAIVALQNEVVNAALDSGKVMALAADSAMTLTHAGGAVVALAEAEELVFRAATGVLTDLAGIHVKNTSGLTGLSVQTGQTLRCDDAEADARVDQSLCRRFGIRSLLMAPLRDNGKTLGVLSVMSAQAGAFTDHDVQTLEILSGLIATALSRAAQFEANHTLLSERTATLTELQESEAQFRSVVGAMQEGLAVQDRDGAILLCNQSAEKLLEYSADAMSAQQAVHSEWRIVQEDGADFPRSRHPSQVALQTGQAQPFSVMGVCRPDREILWLSVSAAPLFHIGQDTPYAALSTFSDITGRRRSEEAVARAEEKYRRIYENSVEGIFQTTMDGRCLSANAATARMLGYDSPEMLVAELSDLGRQLYQRPEDRARFLALLQLQEKATGFEVPFRRRDGSVVWVSMNGRLQRDERGQIEYLEGSLQDITERRAAEQRLLDYNVVLEFQKQEMEKANQELEQANARLEALATLDGLTGLKNHRAFQERLAEEFGRATRYATPLSLVMLDVDHFKEYNDAFGHPAGDDVLKAVADALQGAVRECDFLARYGGEEFALVLPQTGGEGAFVIAERCRAAIEAAQWDSRPVTASFGVAAFSLAMPGYAALVAEADELLYVAKANGRNQVASTHAVRAETIQELQLS